MLFNSRMAGLHRYVVTVMILFIGFHSQGNDNIDSNDLKYAEPLRVGVIGLVHTHVHWILGREKSDDIEIVGIVEPNRALAEQYSKQHGYSMDIVFGSLEEMVNKVRPEAVTAFNTIYGHLEVVEYCAPRGIHVMVEKPMAVNLDHALRMIELASHFGIELLTNYETTWYASHHKSYQIVNEKELIGEPRKMIFYTGHPGPVEIGCNVEFLEWLTDPLLNGGGALTDFGCYGANIATWILKGKLPNSVTCITQQIKPELYPHVEDEATIVLTYDKCQVIIQASWNWSHNRKETEVYGTTGYVKCKNGIDLEVLENEVNGSYHLVASPLKIGHHDPFALLNQVVKHGYKLPAFDLSSMENNLIVMQILNLARISAESGKTVYWREHYKQHSRQ